MEPNGYELLKIETKIDGLEKELSILFDDFRLVESKDGVSNKWCLDHDHETHEYRGWICHKCNNAIGRLNEDAQTALNIHKYLLENK